MNQDQDLPKSLVPYYSIKFLYQAILSSIEEADRTSISPSPSISTAYTERATSALVVMVREVKLSEPSFSYQAILSSLTEADRTSMSPSPSRSTAYTERAPSALVVMVWEVNEVGIVLKPLEVN